MQDMGVNYFCFFLLKAGDELKVISFHIYVTRFFSRSHRFVPSNISIPDVKLCVTVYLLNPVLENKVGEKI